MYINLSVYDFSSESAWEDHSDTSERIPRPLSWEIHARQDRTRLLTVINRASETKNLEAVYLLQKPISELIEYLLKSKIINLIVICQGNHRYWKPGKWQKNLHTWKIMEIGKYHGIWKKRGPDQGIYKMSKALKAWELWLSYRYMYIYLIVVDGVKTRKSDNYIRSFASLFI